MSIRKLKYSDCLTLSKLIKKLADKVGANADLLSLISSQVITSNADNEKEAESVNSKNVVYLEIGSRVLNMLITYLEEDLNEWFASLLSVSVEELLEMPFDTILVVIDELLAMPDVPDFFTGAWRLFKKIQGYQTLFQGRLTE